MAAIKASRSAGRQALTGVNLEGFSIPHPSGTGDLLSDATLVMTPGRRYNVHKAHYNEYHVITIGKRYNK